MRLHYLQHVAFEDAANIARWAQERGHAVSGTRLFAGESPPSLNSFDWLAVMGGPMNIYQHDAYPWLVAEKEFLKGAIAEKKVVIGVCLGAQLIADVLGGKVYANGHKEIGWFPVSLTSSGKQSPLMAGLSEVFTACHWHGDTFHLPPDAVHLATSEACPNQAFSYQGHVLALQFHLDYSAASVEQMLKHCADDLTDGRFVQSAAELADCHDRAESIRDLLYRLLDNLLEATAG